HTRILKKELLTDLVTSAIQEIWHVLDKCGVFLRRAHVGRQLLQLLVGHNHGAHLALEPCVHDRDLGRDNLIEPVHATKQLNASSRILWALHLKELTLSRISESRRRV